MSQVTEGRRKSFEAGAALVAFRRVVLSAGVLQYAGVNDADIGTLNEGVASGAMGAVNLRTAEGTEKMVASEAISQGARVYAAANGKVSDTKSPVYIGTALEAATADGDVIEVLRANGLKIVYGQHTTVAAADTVVTGLTSVVSVVASFETDPSTANLLVSAQVGDQAGSPAAGSIIIKTWKPTANDNVTPTAATSFSKLVNYIAIGT